MHELISVVSTVLIAMTVLILIDAKKHTLVLAAVISVLILTVQVSGHLFGYCQTEEPTCTYAVVAVDALVVAACMAVLIRY